MTDEKSAYNFTELVHSDKLTKPGEPQVLEVRWNLNHLGVVSDYFVAIKDPTAPLGYRFWTGPQSNNFSEFKAWAWSTNNKHKAIAQACLLIR